jgi:hypothetical protein
MHPQSAGWQLRFHAASGTESGACVGGILDGAVQIKTRRKWKWLMGPRKRARRAVANLKPAALPAQTIAVQRQPPGHEIIVWTDKYRISKQYAAGRRK